MSDTVTKFYLVMADQDFEGRYPRGLYSTKAAAIERADLLAKTAPAGHRRHIVEEYTVDSDQQSKDVYDTYDGESQS